MQNATILLVEDETDILEGMRDLLQIVDIGYELEVFIANNGQAALTIIEEQPPDLIVSDIMMPIMSGYELLQAVRRNPNWTHIPFIFLTAKGKHEEIHKGRTSGANLYITKPFNSHELTELIGVQLKRSLEIQATRQQNMGLLKQNLMQVLNHEFRTPLTYVTAYLDMIMVDTDQGIDDSLPEYLRGIQAGCVRLTQLVKDFVQVLELQMGETEQQFQAEADVLADVTALVSNVITRYTPLAEQKGVTIHSDLLPELPPVVGVADSLKNALGRVLENSIKFTRMFRRIGGNVFVKTAVFGSDIHITFQDEGMGFPQHASDRLFELFYQHNRDLQEQQGAGIGLAIAQGLINLHGGHIQVNSVEKEGSTFTIILPAYQEDGPTKPPSSETAQRQATILLVEDDVHLLIGLEDLLQIYDGKYILNVLTAENGQVGLSLLAKNKVDLIISDIMMPEMGGYEFLAEVRKNPNWLQIPFIFLTAKVEHHEVHEGLRSGAEAYISKPYNSDHVLDMVVSQLDRYFQTQRAALQSFEQLKRSILDLITPELQQPLSSVSQFSAELGKHIQNVETAQELLNSLEDIQGDSITLTRLVEDFITLAEIWTGEANMGYDLRAGLIASPFSLLHEVVQLYQLKQPNVPVSLEIPPEDQQIPPIWGVMPLITDSLQRLVNSCLQRQTEPGVTLSLELPDADVVQFVITADLPLSKAAFEQMQFLFAGEQLTDMTFRTETSLQIAYGNISLHNGRITIQPQNPADLPDGTNKPYQIIVAIPIYTQ